MSTITIETQALYQLIDEVLDYAEEKLGNTTKNEPEWIGTQEAKQLLGFTSRTKMQQLRDNHIIKYTRIGRNFKYHRKSIVQGRKMYGNF
ncbi:helix-turn-helix domain-containing protein [Aquimarina sp. ERC-38]|uniref:hypothetical protein n=1 Tax=Aquimarina sp. ERC-38 TaxID=2949996 RepID=UPI002246EF82|nr:hypothetical protein [Aquimarina sp. ERC-38]UZO82116.1 helix-turn-helix domain-containing protein [Aquimarina sp. ERC-38]